MTTSPATFLTSVTSDDAALTPAQCAYFRARLRSRVHEVIVKLFVEKRERDGLTKAELARRLGRAPEQITRWLSAPGNLRLDTVSDLLLAMKSELEFTATTIELSKSRRNVHHEYADIQPTIQAVSKRGSTSVRVLSTNMQGAKMGENGLKELSYAK